MKILENSRWFILAVLLAIQPVLFSQGLPAQGNIPGVSAPQTESRAITAMPSVAVSSDYVLKPNDVVSVSVFQEEELSCLERIAGDGTISMPLVGRIKIVGLTPVSASSAINSALKQGYLVNPQATVSVSEATKEYFTLLGQVSTPGPVEIPSTTRINLLQAIGMGGGFTRLANPSKVTIKRTEGGRESIINVDAKKLSGKKGDDAILIQPGDVITVKERLF